MSHAVAAAAPASIEFVPFSSRPADACPPQVPFDTHPLIQQIVTELGRPLAELAGRLRRLGPGSGGTIVLLAGCQRAVGCTTVAAALARSAARDHEVLLVDGDLHQPGLARLAGIEPALTWEGILERDDSFPPTFLKAPAAQTFQVLAMRSPAAAPEELINRPEMARLLARWRSEYNLIVLDGGSVWESGRLWGRQADIAIVVCDAGRTLADEWSRAWDSLEEAGTHVMGMIETFG